MSLASQHRGWAWLTRKAEGASRKNQAHGGSKARLSKHKGEPAVRQHDRPWGKVGGGRKVGLRARLGMGRGGPWGWPADVSRRVSQGRRPGPRNPWAL